MTFHPDRAEKLAAIADLLRTARNPTVDLLSTILHAVSETGEAAQSSRFARLSRLTEAGAWTDAALAILEMELPHLKLRRVVYDESEWHCSLSLHREFPDWLDDPIEASHSNLSLALLEAIIQAMRYSIVASDEHSMSTGLRMRPALLKADLMNPVCCDNFA